MMMIIMTMMTIMRMMKMKKVMMFMTSYDDEDAGDDNDCDGDDDSDHDGANADGDVKAEADSGSHSRAACSAYRPALTPIPCDPCSGLLTLDPHNHTLKQIPGATEIYTLEPGRLHSWREEQCSNQMS